MTGSTVNASEYASNSECAAEVTVDRMAESSTDTHNGLNTSITAYSDFLGNFSTEGPRNGRIPVSPSMPGAIDAWAEVSNDVARAVVTSAMRAGFDRNHEFNTISPELAGIMAALSTSGDNPTSILADYTGPTGSISDQDLARSYSIAIARNRSDFYDLYDKYGRNFDAARQAASEIHEQELAESERANDANQDGETWQDLAGPRNGNDCLAVFDRAAQIPVSQTIKFLLDHEFLAIVIPNRVNGFQSNTPMHLRPQNGALWRPRLPHNSDCTPWF